VHTQRNRELWEAMTTGSDTRRQPLMFAMTTEGVAGECPVQEELDKKVAAVSEDPAADPTFFPFVWQAPADADWKDEETWYTCNPALGIFLSIDAVRAKCKSAQTNPTEENEFRRLRLNQKVQQATRFIPMDDYDQCTRSLMDLSYARGLASAALTSAARST